MGILDKLNAFRPSRREVVQVAAVSAGGALLVGCSLPDILSMGAKTEVGAFGPFIKITRDAVTVVIKHIEFGQGSHAGLAAIVAEELGAAWDEVKIEFAPGNAKLYANAMMGAQGTGGSSAISNSWEQLRKAGAAARAMFVEAAAAQWSVSAAEITVAESRVSHPGGKTASFGDLLEAAGAIRPPAEPTLKSPADFTLIGTDRVRRKDSVAKSNGTARFTQDVRMPQMLSAVVAHPPRFGARMETFDDAAARQVPGVRDVFKIPTGVAVVADNTWAALQGREALKVTWDESKAEMRGTAELTQLFHDIAAGKTEAKWQSFESAGEPGDFDGPVLETSFDFPFLSHAAMEPMNCVAQVGNGPTRLTLGSQSPSLDQMNTAMIVGSLPGSVEVESLLAGGSFGRRTNFKSDYVTECVHIAKKVGGGRPVKLMWTREDDQRAGYYRPMVHHTVRVGVNDLGLPVYWRHRIVTQSLMKGSPVGGGGLDETAVEGAKGSPYLKAIAAGGGRVDGQVALPDSGVPVLWWRSVGATHTAVVMEHTIDQLARRAGKDPVDYRRALYQAAGATRHLAVLNLAAEKAGWGASGSGWTQGVAVHESFGSVVAQVAEVKLENGEPRVGRVVTAIDCGTAIAPDQIAAQMEGGTCYGLSAALYGQVTMVDGEVRETNFDGYRVLRMNEAPTVETHILPSTKPPSGVGEPGTPVIAPAVANALLRITGKPTTSLPFVKPA